MDRRPQAGGLYCTPNFEEWGSHYRCARARLTAFTLLFINWSQLHPIKFNVLFKCLISYNCKLRYALANAYLNSMKVLLNWGAHWPVRTSIQWKFHWIEVRTGQCMGGRQWKIFHYCLGRYYASMNTKYGDN